MSTRRDTGGGTGFHLTTCPKLTGPEQHQDYIINMDQTPVPFTYNAKSTLDVVGVRIIHICKLTSDTKCATCALMVTASGKLLTPMIIFKGKPNEQIVKHEFPEYPEGCVYSCQDNAWMDEQAMLQWVEQILKPFINTAPEDVVPVLFLDSYRYHIMAFVVNEIQALGVEVKHIPSGCTYLCQHQQAIQKAFTNEMGMLDDGRASNRWNNKSTYEKGHCTVGVVYEKQNLCGDSEKFMETWRVFMVS